jgi:hypothetical protein
MPTNTQRIAALEQALADLGDYVEDLRASCGPRWDFARTAVALLTSTMALRSTTSTEGSPMKKARSVSQRVDSLLQQRRRLLDADYTSLCDSFGFGGVTGAMYVGRDADLTAAIAAWRERRLGEIDAQLRDLGIADIDAIEKQLAQIREQYRARHIAVIEAALAGGMPVRERPKAMEPQVWIF